MLYTGLCCVITCLMIVFMPLTNPRSSRAVHKFPYCPLSGLILHDIPRHLTFELDHERRKCTCKKFFIILFIFGVHVHVEASLAVTCNKCVIDCGFGQYGTQYTPSRLRRSGVYRTVLPSPQSTTHNYTLNCVVLYTGLLCCVIHWTTVLCYTLDCAVLCTRLLCCVIYWTVLCYALDYCVVLYTGLCCVIHWTVLCYTLDCVVLYTRLLCCVIYWTVLCYTLECVVLYTGVCCVIH